MRMRLSSNPTPTLVTIGTFRAGCCSPASPAPFMNCTPRGMGYHRCGSGFLDVVWSGMSAVSFPVKRPVGRALVLGTSSSRSQPLAAMQTLGYTCAELDDPYAAAAELPDRKS